MRHWPRRLYQALIMAENGIILSLLLALIIISVVQILMRNLFGSGILWVEEFIRIAVLWIALVGAMIGSRNNQHIAIDLITHYLPEHYYRHLKTFTNFACGLICLIIAYHSLLFVQMEWEDGGLAFSIVPNWLCVSILPIAFLIIACRYLLSCFCNIKAEAAIE